MGALLALVGTAYLDGVRASEPRPNDPYRAQRRDPMTYEMDFRVIVTPPYHTQQLRVWMPVPPTDSVQTYTPLGFETFPASVTPTRHREEKFGNQFAYFQFRAPKGAQIIRHRFRITTAELHWNVDPDRVAHLETWPATFTPYLQSDAAVTVNADLRAELQTFLPQPERSYSDLTTTMDWLNHNLTYDHSSASLQASALHALRNRRGHCSDYHGLCSAFGRALGYPTRVT
jgi:transglutaminase-like putative cysteine protease